MVETFKKALTELPKENDVQELASGFENAKLEVIYSKLIDPLSDKIVTKCTIKKLLKGPNEALEKITELLDARIASDAASKEEGQ